MAMTGTNNVRHSSATCARGVSPAASRMSGTVQPIPSRLRDRHARRAPLPALAPQLSDSLRRNPDRQNISSGRHSGPQSHVGERGCRSAPRDAWVNSLADDLGTVDLLVLLQADARDSR